MKVDKEIFYHANSSIKYNVGDTIIFDENTTNKMYDLVYNTSFMLNNTDANELLINKKRNKDMTFTVDELKLIANTVNASAKILRELALEEIRQQYYPTYPSRLRCMYVCENENDAINWVEVLKRNGKQAKQILTLELTGTIFKGDGLSLFTINKSYNDHLKDAKEYWNNSSNKQNEILFMGTAKVVGVKNID